MRCQIKRSANSTWMRSCVRLSCWHTPRSIQSPGMAHQRVGSASTATRRFANGLQPQRGSLRVRPVSHFGKYLSALRRDGWGLVTPYLDDVQTKIMDNWAASGFACSAERHLRLQDNFSFATVSEDTISEMVRAVVQQGCEAVAILCTNMRGARIVDALERELDVPIYDSVATTIWKSLLLAGEEPRKLASWGRLYRDDRLNDVRHLGSVAVE